MVNDNKMGLNVTGWEVLVWIYLAQNMNKWRVLVNTAMNQRFPQNATKFRLAEKLLAS
jgi:hypothetical protein